MAGRLYPTNSADAGDAWRTFAQEHGVSYTALIEALAGELRRLCEPGVKLPAFWWQIIEEARAHDAEARSRSTPD